MEGYKYLWSRRIRTCIPSKLGEPNTRAMVMQPSKIQQLIYRVLMQTNTFKYTKQGSQINPIALNKPRNHSTQVHSQGSPTSGHLGGLVVHDYKIFKKIDKSNQIKHKKHSLKDQRPNDASKDATQEVASLVVFSSLYGSRGRISSYLALLVVLSPEMPSKVFSQPRSERWLSVAPSGQGSLPSKCPQNPYKKHFRGVLRLGMRAAYGP